MKDLAGSQVAVMNPTDNQAQFSGADRSGDSVKRWISGLTTATYDFQVQFRSDGSCCLDLGAWIFTLERYT